MLMSRAPVGRTIELEAGARDVRDRLRRSGASRALVQRVLRAVLAQDASGTHAIDAAAREIGSAFAVQPSPRRSEEPHVLAFVGPTGAGKTSVLAKLGRRLQRAGRRVLYVSFDPVGVGALEKVGGVGTDKDKAEIPLVAATGISDVRRALKRLGGADVVLVDTPGYSPRDEIELLDLAYEVERLAKLGALHTYLVLPASAGRSALELAERAFRPCRPTATVLTKLDETTAPAPVLEIVLAERLPVGFLCDGQDVRTHLLRPTPDHFADLLLRGRLA
jgi:flagellar biosynthesis protein FlhF